MRVALRWLGHFGLFLLIVLAVALAWLWFASSQKLSARAPINPEKLERPAQSQLADAQRQLRVMGCISCHGEGLRGKQMFSEAMVATIYAPNLTLIAARSTDQQLAQAIRQGVGVDGRSLLVMPSAQYSHLGDSEVAALIAAIRSVPQGGSETPAVSLGPLGRVGVVSGKLRPQPEMVAEHQQRRPLDLGPDHRTAWKIAATNCSECHGADLSGGSLASGEVGPDLMIVGAYDLPAFKRLLKEGIAPGDRKLGLMREVARNDFRHLRDDEIEQLHAYLVMRAQKLSR